MLYLGLSKSIQKKVDKQIVETFAVEEFNFTEVIIDSEIAKDLPSAFSALPLAIYGSKSL